MKYGYLGDPKFEPLSPWNYFWLTILYSIPIVGFICLLIHAISSSNINRRNFARSYFCIFVIIIIAILIFALADGLGTGLGSLFG